jgi:hypothetical protein
MAPSRPSFEPRVWQTAARVSGPTDVNGTAIAFGDDPVSGRARLESSAPVGWKLEKGGGSSCVIAVRDEAGCSVE